MVSRIGGGISRSVVVCRPYTYTPHRHSTTSTTTSLPIQENIVEKMASFLSSAVHATTAAAHSAAVAIASTHHIKEGTIIPEIECRVDSINEKKINLGKLEGKNVIVTVPAAFSPSCSDQVPEYIKKYDEFVAKGVKGIYVVAVNDIFAMNAWKSKLSGDKTTPIKFVADDQGEFASATGLIFDATDLLGGPRAKRSAIVVEGNKVLAAYIETNPPEVTVSSADSVLAKL